MRSTRLLLPLGIAALLLAVVAPAAMAAPTSAFAPVPTALHPGRVSVGFGVGLGVPVAPPPRRVVVAPPPRGHYEIRVERVWVPGELVGYDVYGNPVRTLGYWTERRVQVWVPYVPVRERHGRHGHHGYPVRRVVAPAPAPVTTVGFGVTYTR